VAQLFESVNGDRILAQVEGILAGTFEQQTCPACGGVFRPEHTMLYSQFSARLWIVMHPPDDRARYELIERGVELVLERNFAAAAPLVAAGVRGVQPRLVFGQLLLTEALRAHRAALSPPILECAKLLAVRRNLSDLMRQGPSQLVFEAIEPDGRLRCGIVDLDGRRRAGELHLPADAIAEARATQAMFAELYPALFSRPYVSACRYLYDGAA
jgi:hypothetical protein